MLTVRPGAKAAHEVVAGSCLPRFRSSVEESRMRHPRRARAIAITRTEDLAARLAVAGGTLFALTAGLLALWL